MLRNFAAYCYCEHLGLINIIEKHVYGESILVTHFLKLQVNANQGLILILFLFTVPTTSVRLVLSENRKPSNERTHSLLFLISNRKKQFAF